MSIIDQLIIAGVQHGDLVEATFAKGNKVSGELEHRGLAGWCVLNPYGVPMSIEKAKSIRPLPKGARQ